MSAGEGGVFGLRLDQSRKPVRLLRDGVVEKGCKFKFKFNRGWPGNLPGTVSSWESAILIWKEDGHGGVGIWFQLGRATFIGLDGRHRS